MKRPTSEQPALPADPEPRSKPGVALSFAEFEAEGPRVARNPGAQPLLVSAVPRELPADRLLEVGAKPGGAAFHVGESAVARMQLVARQRPKHLELNLALTLAAARQFDENARSLALVDFEVQGHRTAAKARRVEHAGAFVADFVPPGQPQAWAGRLRLQISGATSAVRAANLRRALEALYARRLLDPADQYQGECYRRLALLRQLNPRAAELHSRQLSSVKLAELDLALAQAGADSLRIVGSKLEEVFEGHCGVVDPELGEQYAQLGVRAVMVTGLTPQAAADVLREGVLSRCEAMERGAATLPGTEQHEVTGAAQYALARLLTVDAMKQGVEVPPGVTLVSTGAAMRVLLARTDWHAYPKASDGSTVAQTQQTDSPRVAEPPPGSFSARPVLKGLVTAVGGGGIDVLTGAKAGQFASDNEVWFERGIRAGAFTRTVVRSEAEREAVGATLPVVVAKRFGDLEPLPT